MKVPTPLVLSFCLLAAPVLWSQVLPNGAATAIFPATPAVPVAPAPITLEAKVQEVNLILTVKDHKGHFVRDLEPSELTILDNGTRQNMLTYFQSESGLPLQVALVLDTSASVTYRFDAEKDTIRTFLDEVVRPRDSVMLFTFNQEIRLLGPIMHNWKQISREVKKLKPGGETALYDAICAAGRWLSNASRPARRIIIVITDGQENGSAATLEDGIAAALKAEAAIYAVNVTSFDNSDQAARGGQILRQLADATGGEQLRAGPDGDVGGAFRKIREELRSQYVVAYKPSNLSDQIFHWILVTAPNKLRVRCRTGYYVK